MYAARVPLLLVPVLVILAVIALIPISIVQRFRVGTARRTARGWVAGLNLFAVLFSIAFFVLGAFITSQWVPEALTYALIGLAVGAALGAAGLLLTRWEYVNGRLHYTPNRWLILAITLIVAARVFYGFWRSWEAWSASVNSLAWVTASGVATSMSAGAVVLGYYAIYWIGVRRRIRRELVPQR
jgi:hypothetical protein